MGLFPTFYAHWKLNRMMRVWRKSRKLISKLDDFIKTNGTPQQASAFASEVKTMDGLFAEIEQYVEDTTLSDLKERA